MFKLWCERGIRYTRKCSEISVKNAEQNLLQRHHSIARFDDALPRIFKLKASPVADQSLPQNDKKRRKRKGEKKPKSLKT